MTAPSPSESDSLLPVAHGSSKSVGSSASATKTLFVRRAVYAVLLGLGLVSLFTFGFASFSADPPSAALSETVLGSPRKKSPKRRYNATQFISLTINTYGGVAKKGECVDRVVDTKTGTCYLGDLKNLTEDAYHRIGLIAKALIRVKNDASSSKPYIDHRANVLKILMLPEFFLRGPYGAYPFDMLKTENGEEGALIRISDGMRQLISDPVFEDHLFVFGTAIFAHSTVDAETPWYEKTDLEASDIHYYNFAPVFRGGTRDRKKYFMVQKHFISKVDFLSRAGDLPNPTDSNVNTYSSGDASPFLSKVLAKRNTTLVKDNVLEIDGIRIGIEICLDHRMGALWNALKSKKGKLVDVQLITSAGMAIERGPNPVVPGGIVYLSDGEASSAACLRTDTGPFDPKKVCIESPAGLKHVPRRANDGYSNFLSLSSCLDVAEIDGLKGYYSIHQPQGCANTLAIHGIHVMHKFDYYPPSWEIYPTVDLPKKL